MSLQHVFTSDIKGGCFISDSLRSSPQDNSELQDIYWGKTPMKEIRTWAEVGGERLQIIIVPIHIKGKKRWIHSTYERQVPIPAFSRTPTDPEPSIVLYSVCVCVCVCVCTHARGMLSGVQLCNAMDYSPPGPSVLWIFQARTLEWVAISCSRGSSWSRDQTHFSCFSCVGRQILYHCLLGSPLFLLGLSKEIVTKRGM